LFGSMPFAKMLRRGSPPSQRLHMASIPLAYTAAKREKPFLN